MPNGAKHWCFTLNNYTQEEEAVLEALGTEGVGITYLVYGRETGDNGTPHLQGYCAFDQKRVLSYVRNILGARGHYECARGSPKQAAQYCKKDNNFREFGTLPKGRGARTDLADALASVKEGATRRVLIEEHAQAYQRGYRVLNEAMLLYARACNWMPETYVFYGHTGTGKTRKAFEDCEELPYMHPGGMWFDGYDGQQSVIFDDFGGSEFKITYLLKLLDRYPMRVPVKGAFVSWVPKKIYITSNYSPKEWYPNAKDEHKKALYRRFEKVTRFRKLEQPVVDDEEEVIVHDILPEAF